MQFSKTLKVFCVVFLVGLVVLAFTAASRYQFTHHIVYNNTGSTIFLQQEHYGVRLDRDKDGSANSYFDKPLQARVWFGGSKDGRTASRRLKFREDSVVEVMEPEKTYSITLPNEVASENWWGRKFTYQLNADGLLYVVDAEKERPVVSPGLQPQGFPIPLFEDRKVEWKNTRLRGSTLDLIAGDVARIFRFGEDGATAVTIGSKVGAVAAPALYWRVEGEHLIVSETRNGPAFEDLSEPVVRGNMLRAKMLNGEVGNFLWTISLVED